MYQIAICDDLDTQVYFIEQLVQETLHRLNKTCKISSYTSSEFFRCDIEEGKYFDLILTDIEMPKTSGMELASIIQQHLPHSILIFITAHLKYAVDAYEYQVFRYIPKEDLRQKLLPALTDAFHLLDRQIEHFYSVISKKNCQKINLRDILYIQREGKNSVFHLINGTTISERKSLNAVHEELNSSDFMFAERGCIINLIHVTDIRQKTIILNQSQQIPSNQERLKEIRKVLLELWR